MRVDRPSLARSGAVHAQARVHDRRERAPGAATRVRLALAALVLSAVAASCRSGRDDTRDTPIGADDAAALCARACERTGRCGLELVGAAGRELPPAERERERQRGAHAAEQDAAACESACQKRVEAGDEANAGRRLDRCLGARDCSQFLRCLAAELG